MEKAMFGMKREWRGIGIIAVSVIAFHRMLWFNSDKSQVIGIRYRSSGTRAIIAANRSMYVEYGRIATLDALHFACTGLIQFDYIPYFFKR